MTTSRIDKLIAAEVGEPTYSALTQERLNGKLYTAVLFNGAIVWQKTDDDQLPGGRQLYIKDGDRG